MSAPRIIPRRTATIAVALLLLFLLLAAAINVPWALTFMVARLDENKITSVRRDPGDIPAQWPIVTPHAVAWPPPQSWQEGHIFGCTIYDVRTADAADHEGFTLNLQRLGWPLAVIEKKHMWWDDNDPALNGFGAPQPDPSPSLIWSGLLFNPLILGGGAWIIVVFPWLVTVITLRRSRRRHRRCLECGYPIGAAETCTECGAELTIVAPRTLNKPEV